MPVVMLISYYVISYVTQIVQIYQQVGRNVTNIYMHKKINLHNQVLISFCWENASI